MKKSLDDQERAGKAAVSANVLTEVKEIMEKQGGKPEILVAELKALSNTKVRRKIWLNIIDLKKKSLGVGWCFETSKDYLSRHLCYTLQHRSRSRKNSVPECCTPSKLSKWYYLDCSLIFGFCSLE